jgi:thiol-disulfide isomerase/thioredoxin
MKKLILDLSANLTGHRTSPQNAPHFVWKLVGNRSFQPALFLFFILAAAPLMAGGSGETPISPQKPESREISSSVPEKAIPQDLTQAFSRAGLQVLDERVPITDFSLSLLNGKPQTLSGLKGRAIFLNFWATWCPPCREEMPSMEVLYRRFKDKGLEFLAVNIQEDKKDVAAFMREFGLTFPVILDSTGEVSAIYGIRGIPTTYIIDREGGIIAAAVGGRPWDSADMISAFDLLLRYER